MAFIDALKQWRQTATANNAVKIAAEDVTVEKWVNGDGQPVAAPAPGSWVVVPVLVEQISSDGSTVYSDLYKDDNSPNPGATLKFLRQNDGPLTVSADKPFDSEPLSTHHLIWSNDAGWQNWAVSEQSQMIEGLKWQRSYYIAWKRIQWQPTTTPDPNPPPNPNPEPLKAAFLVNPSQGPAPLYVRLENHSQGAISHLEWVIDDESDNVDPIISNLENPTIQLDSPGNYLVRLTVEDADGNQDEEIKRGAITVLPAPTHPPSRTVGTHEAIHYHAGRGILGADANVYAEKPTDCHGVVWVAIRKDELPALVVKNPDDPYIMVGLKIEAMEPEYQKFLESRPEV